ncbi:MAG: tetratricopeptide repeat protein [Gammaproteobacteria bacterium]|nr:tetratricopeptide repeat protein [Gammaproteobacteria bacterium]
MTIRYSYRSAAISLMFVIAFSTLQIARSAAPDKQPKEGQSEAAGDLSSNTANLENESAVAGEFQTLGASDEYSDVMGLAYDILAKGAEYGAETRELLVEPLMKHATVRKQAGEILQAERAGDLAIELIERNGGVFDPALVEPLVFLAQLHQDGGDHPAAMERLNRAQHILHRTDGVMTGLQLPILDQMKISFAAMGQDEEAGMITDMTYAINVCHLDINSLEFVPFILDQAEFKSRTWQFRAARKLYSDALAILERFLPKNDPGFVDALNGFASVRYREQSRGVPSSRLIVRSPATTIQAPNKEIRKTQQIGKILAREWGPKTSPYSGRKEGTRTLQTVIDIMEEHPERFSTGQRAEVYIRLGDWYMLIRKPRLADGAYRKVWQLLADEGDAPKLLAGYFGQPKSLKYFKPSLPQSGPGSYENYDDGYVAVTYSVNENGAVRNLKFVESNSPSAMNVRMRDAVKQAIYRPRYVDAIAVVTDDLTLREEFSGTAYIEYSLYPPSVRKE